MIRLQRFTFNFVEENTYVLSDETREAVIIDCGAFLPAERDRLSEYIAANGLRPVWALQTHAHFDHLFGAHFLAETYGTAPRFCADEAETYAAAADQMAQFLHRTIPLTLPAPGDTFRHGDTIRFGNSELQVIATPGHTPGGVCFYARQEGILLTGDSLFRGDIGRCDLPGGNETALVNALRERIMTLPDDVKVYPGHGAETTIGEQRATNVYIR